MFPTILGKVKILASRISELGSEQPVRTEVRVQHPGLESSVEVSCLETVHAGSNLSPQLKALLKGWPGTDCLARKAPSHTAAWYCVDFLVLGTLSDYAPKWFHNMLASL